MASAPAALPIDPLVPEILGALAGSANLVIEAPPGAGKTTRVPPALLNLEAGEVVVLEPRRIAARLAARRVAAERGERVGNTVGYQVRFETAGGPRTKLWFLTEGVLVRRLLSNPRLAGTGVVVLDEFHERHLEGDLALALLRRLQLTARPELRIVVMSATFDPAPVSRFLGNCPVLESKGRLYPLDIRYTPHSAVPLEQQVAAAAEHLVSEGSGGDILVFLPGAAEIRRCAQAAAALARRTGHDIVPLHGDLSPKDQDRAVLPGPRPKIILSTNVAESSITVEGVAAVIDSGLARIASDSPWSGLPLLKITRISKASANQRAGRAGRLRPGRVIRLYPEADFARRVEAEAPEITRRELSQLCLDLLAYGVPDPQELVWLDPPPVGALDAALELLRHLGAVDSASRLTEIGRSMARLPLHPRLARLVVEAERRGCAEAGCAAAAVLSAGERLAPEAAAQSGPSDLLALLDAPRSWRSRRLESQLRRLVKPSADTAAGDDALLISVLTAFPDRVARRRSADELLLAAGGAARLAPSSVVRSSDLLVAVDIEERSERGLPLVRLASAVRPEWLFDLYPERIRERDEVEWNRAAERVETVSALLFGGIVIEESRSGAPDSDRAARLLAERALEAGVARFGDAAEIDAFLNRVAFAARHSACPELGEEDVREALGELCRGLASFRELAAAAGGGGLVRALRSRLTVEQARLLDEVAPERVRLPGGRRVRVHYERDKPPWIAARLQDFFGMKEGPRIARGAVPVVLHLLAPNQRPVQTTTDLAGFWERLYPQLRRELRRRYPKHPWPEDPV